MSDGKKRILDQPASIGERHLLAVWLVLLISHNDVPLKHVRALALIDDRQGGGHLYRQHLNVARQNCQGLRDGHTARQNGGASTDARAGRRHTPITSAS
jgi:hypothetical protein